jgi:hypothetical protein
VAALVPVDSAGLRGPLPAGGNQQLFPPPVMSFTNHSTNRPTTAPSSLRRFEEKAVSNRPLRQASSVAEFAESKKSIPITRDCDSN